VSDVRFGWHKVTRFVADRVPSRHERESPRERIRRERTAIAEWHRRKPDRDQLRRRFWRGNEDDHA
jgi:hypothetical protein